ncbi:hypothetical protein [Gracilibacillus xinjiangensis]|uniref:Uncharacterized protein n=1 Tax=Gracilibacillus xinjiangensis TaxID=1193282 RepID=A0ABV8WUY7_9BACI
MDSINNGKKSVHVNERKSHLLYGLSKMKVTHTADGRNIENCSLYTLEYTYIQEKIKRGGIVEWQPTPEKEGRH